MPGAAAATMPGAPYAVRCTISRQPDRLARCRLYLPVARRAAATLATARRLPDNEASSPPRAGALAVADETDRAGAAPTGTTITITYYYYYHYHYHYFYYYYPIYQIVYVLTISQKIDLVRILTISQISNLTMLVNIMMCCWSNYDYLLVRIMIVCCSTL